MSSSPWNNATGTLICVDRVDRRPLPPHDGIGADQAGLVSRLELVAVTHEHLDVGDAVVRRTGSERVSERKRRKGRVATGAPAADGEPVAVDLADRCQVFGSRDGVVDIDDAPLPFELLPVLPTESG